MRELPKGSTLTYFLVSYFKNMQYVSNCESYANIVAISQEMTSLFLPCY